MNNQKHVDKIYKMRYALMSETDRGAILLSTSFVDYELELLFKDYFVESSTKTMFSGNGSLATFSSKIEMAFALGLITKDDFSDLHLIRKIRNEFAHSYENISFDTESVYHRINSLKHHFHDENVSYRKKIITTICGIIGAISGKRISLNRIQEFKIDQQKLKEYNDSMKNSQKIIKDYFNILDDIYENNPNKDTFIAEELLELKENSVNFLKNLFSKIEELKKLNNEKPKK